VAYQATPASTKECAYQHTPGEDGQNGYLFLPSNWKNKIVETPDDY